MASQRSTPTLEDVAREAGVSTATVSRCLNSPKQVMESTRARVMSAVQSLDYSPNFGARVMAARRTRTIGAIIPTMENAIFARGLQAFQEELHGKGYTLLVACSSYRPDREEEQVRALVARGADGLLLIGHDRDPSICRFLEMQTVPAVAAWAFDEGAELPSIGFDNRKSMRMLAETVLGMGHRKIGMISADTAANDRARLRVMGVKDAMEAKKLPAADLQVVETTYGIDTGARAFEGLMSAEGKPTAIMCGNDVLAAGALRQARLMGLAVPGDVSITGFDDIELAKVLVPALTTVHVPHREMGKKAARLLVEMVEGKAEGRSLELDVSIRMRETLGPPADKN